MAVNGEQGARAPIPVWVWPVAALTAMFLVNAIPHTMAGLLVLNLPTPFSGGPGTLSGPMVNSMWGLSNVVIGAAGLRLLRPWIDRPNLRWTMLLVGLAFTLFLSWAIGSAPLPGRFL